ncbi:MAG: TIM-barrel domain-containing protein, partial [Daejeonella sp.]
ADPNPAPPEPVFWDENTQKIVKEYIKLRYRFLPYNYSLAFENSRSGRPLAMPVNYREPNNARLKSVDDEYLWGDDLLIAPIYEKGKTERQVVFPEGKWLDYLSGKVYTDSAIITADLSTLPIFARSGSFIPMTRDMQNTDNYTSDTLLVKYFPDAETQASFTLYHDDGKDPKALQNDYEALIFTDNYQKIPNTINLMSSKPGKKREIYFEIFNVKKPFRIYFNDNNLILLGTEDQLNKYTNTACYDPLTQILKIHITNSGEEQVLNFD